MYQIKFVLIQLVVLKPVLLQNLCTRFLGIFVGQLGEQWALHFTPVTAIGLWPFCFTGHCLSLDLVQLLPLGTQQAG